MQNVMVRLNAVIFFALTVLLVLAVLGWFSSYMHVGDPKVKMIRLDEVYKMYNFSGQDKAFLKFHLSADLRPAFHWNIKQLYVFVVAEWETDTHHLNQVIIWDRIIESKEDAVIKLKQEKLKYFLLAQGPDLRARDVTLKLMWDHMPLTGSLYMAEDPKNSTFVTPEQLTTSTTKKTRR